ncbi:DUSAM domain-containing protein [Corallococcus sp. ZKHCc1 1396]|uniref:DUSAM domain-containing protein n=1 Tax=Corallococcus soli TaxID=2710757 RepID=A0ABR9PX47_9BACT|nr:DUSAM domain-containing protein [Corallococcus soli]MBE4752501.1 DUSAM domain-containing protein [Corallococcus soli]
MNPEDWNKVIILGRQLAAGAELPQDAELPELLMRMAPQVGIAVEDAAPALATPATTCELAMEIQRRTRDGSYRLGHAFDEADKLVAAGDVAGARTVLERAREVEVVPLYRDQLRAYLDDPQDT